MTRGEIKWQIEQTGYPPVRIKMLKHTQIVIIEQGDNKIHIRIPFMDEFAYLINEVKRWSISP